MADYAEQLLGDHGGVGRYGTFTHIDVRADKSRWKGVSPMDSTTAAILAAIITGGLSLVGVILSNRAASSRMQAQLEKQQAVMDEKIEELTREVRAHNNFAQRVPVLETKLKADEHRIDDLEKQAERLEALHTHPAE